MSRFGLEIRSAAPADAAGLAELFRSADQPVGVETLAGRMEAVRQNGGSVLVALEWEPPSGVIAFSRYAALEWAGLTALITTLLVAPDARRRGIARTLLKSASQAARQWGCDRMVVPVSTEADDLLAFCRATGFELDGGLNVRSLRRRS